MFLREKIFKAFFALFYIYDFCVIVFQLQSDVVPKTAGNVQN